jgi:hypothetical protein
MFLLYIHYNPILRIYLECVLYDRLVREEINVFFIKHTYDVVNIHSLLDVYYITCSLLIFEYFVEKFK